jgi:hypothetical protein
LCVSACSKHLSYMWRSHLFAIRRCHNDAIGSRELSS